MLKIKNAESITLNILGKKNAGFCSSRTLVLQETSAFWWSHVSFIAKDLCLLSVDRIMNEVQPS